MGEALARRVRRRVVAYGRRVGCVEDRGSEVEGSVDRGRILRLGAHPGAAPCRHQAMRPMTPSAPHRTVRRLVALLAGAAVALGAVPAWAAVGSSGRASAPVAWDPAVR